MEQDQAFLEYVVQAIVNHPEDVKSTRTVDERGVLITLDLNPSDMGYVIGRRGQTARAIRTLLKVVGAKNNARVNLKINEPEGSRRPAPTGTAAPVAAPVASVMDDIDTSAVDNLNI
ncbi:KH domain-containing protein [Patescibacteria group bacterium]|nr:KH domain-containing protein [Patescibacteria group bacterium]MBU1721903.1 KH domain-containing protein [Patescibacteria group bacterium]MBU1900865.1 KH domain-containing protein [Patescibacteria group bacterium]